MPSRRQVLAGLGSATVPALAGCLDDSLAFSAGSDPDADWPMARFDATNTAYSPDAKAPREGVRERWTYEGGSATGTPAVVDGTVFLPTTDGLVALDSTSGEERWRAAPSDHPWLSAPTVHGGLVFVGAHDDGGVHAFDAESGEIAWSLEDAGHVQASPHLLAGEHVHQPMLYAGTEAGDIYRIDPATGEITWQTDLFGGISAFAYRTPTLYVGTFGGEVYSFYESGGHDHPPEEGWRRKVGSKVEAILPTANCIFVHTFGGPVRCVQDGAHAGTTRWTADAKWANSAPVHAGSTFFSAGYDGLSAIREFDKRFQWRLRGRYDATAPVAAGDTLYVSSGEAVHAFALDGGTGVGGYRFGAKRWSHPTPAVAVEGLAVADGALFAACEGRSGDNTTLYCLESA